jgi:hypothetical protein
MCVFTATRLDAAACSARERTAKPHRLRHPDSCQSIPRARVRSDRPGEPLPAAGVRQVEPSNRRDTDPRGHCVASIVPALARWSPPRRARLSARRQLAAARYANRSPSLRRVWYSQWRDVQIVRRRELRCSARSADWERGGRPLELAAEALVQAARGQGVAAVATRPVAPGEAAASLVRAALFLSSSLPRMRRQDRIIRRQPLGLFENAAFPMPDIKAGPLTAPVGSLTVKQTPSSSNAHRFPAVFPRLRHQAHRRLSASWPA